MTSWNRSVLITPALLTALSALALMPLVFLFLNSQPSSEPTPWHLLSNSYVTESVFNIIAVSIGAVLVASLLGLGVAWFISETDFHGKNILSALHLIPLTLPSYVYAFTYLSQWEIHTWLPGELKSTWGLAMILGFALYPYVFLLMRLAFASVKIRYREAHHSLGGKRLQYFKGVLLPEILPYWLSGCLLVVLETCSDFGAASILNVPVITTMIFKAWLDLFSFALALQIALIYLVAILIFIILYRKVFQNPALKNEILSPRPSQKKGSLISYIGFVYSWGTALVTVIFPVALLIYWSFSANSISLGEYTTSFTNTLSLAFIVGIAVLSFSLVYHFLLKQTSSKNSFWLKASEVVHIGYAVPGPVLAIGGLGLFTFFSQSSSSSTSNINFLVLIAVLSTKFLLLAKETAGEKWRRQPISWTEASQSLGIGSLVRFWRLDLPYLRAPMAVGFIFVAVETMKEMPITLMLSPLGFRTFSMDIFNYTMEGEWPKAAIPSLTLVAMGLIPVLMIKGRSVWKK